MGFITQVEPIGAVPIAIAEREGANGDGQHVERGRRTVAGRFAGEDAGNIGFERQGLDRVAATGTSEADAQNKLS
jgi:hypothetical protein